METKKP